MPFFKINFKSGNLGIILPDFCYIYWLFAPFFFIAYWPGVGLLLPIGSGVGSIGPIELPINRFGGRYVIGKFPKTYLRYGGAWAGKLDRRK